MRVVERAEDVGDAAAVAHGRLALSAPAISKGSVASPCLGTPPLSLHTTLAISFWGLSRNVHSSLLRVTILPGPYIRSVLLKAVSGTAMSVKRSSPSPDRGSSADAQACLAPSYLYLTDRRYPSPYDLPWDFSQSSSALSIPLRTTRQGRTTSRYTSSRITKARSRTRLSPAPPVSPLCMRTAPFPHPPLLF